MTSHTSTLQSPPNITQQHRLFPHSSHSIYYIPNYIPSNILEALLYYCDHSVRYTKLLNRQLVSMGPRISSPSSSNTSKTPIYLANSIALPSFMQNLIRDLQLDRIKADLSKEASKPLPRKLNHILLNRYLPKQGISAHRDGPAYDPFVFIISLESPIVIRFKLDEMYLQSLGEEKRTEIMKRIDEEEKLPHSFHVVLDANSLIIFQTCVYEYYKHEILEEETVAFKGAVNEEDMKTKYGTMELPRKQRTSLTIRTVNSANKRIDRFFPGLKR